jgi:hypothetical protein
MNYKKQKINWAELSYEERQDILQRRRENLEAGDYNHSSAPLGYKYVRDRRGFRRLVHDQRIAPLIVETCHAIGSGYIHSPRALADRLSWKLGKKLTPGKAVKLMSDPRLVGWYYLPESLGKKLIRGLFKPILTKEAFVRMVRRMKEEGWL